MLMITKAIELSMEKYHGKTVEYWKQNAEEDYLKTPISVLKYITVLEEQAGQLRKHDVVGRGEQLCQHDRSVTNRICDDCGSVITYVPDDDLA